MDDTKISLHFQAIRQQTSAFQQVDAEAWQMIDAALEDLQMNYEEMQTSLEALNVTNQELLQHNQQIAADYSHYRDLFQSLPIACLVTDARGVIWEANQAIARLLNVPQPYVLGKSLAAFVAAEDLQNFYTKLNQLSPTDEVQNWQMSLCTWRGKSFEAQLHVAIALHDTGSIQALRIGVYELNQLQKMVNQLPSDLCSGTMHAEVKNAPVAIATIPEWITSTGG